MFIQYGKQTSSKAIPLDANRDNIMQKIHFKILITAIILALVVFSRDAKMAASPEKPDFNQ